MDKGKNGPMLQTRIGRFQVSIWKRNKIVPAKNDVDVEREVQKIKACIQYSTYSRINNSWENQTIWCKPAEIRDLVQVLDKLNETVQNNRK